MTSGWPSTSAGYSFAPASPPVLTIKLAFDVLRYASAPPGAARRAALADLETYARVHRQLDRTGPDGAHGVTISVSTSLDEGVVHVLPSPGGDAFRGYVRSAWQYLDGVLKGEPPGTDPITASVQVPVAATNPADVYELTVTLALDGGGLAVELTAAPRFGDGGPAGSPRPFAEAFEAAYATPVEVLKIAVAEASRPWVVRTGVEPTGPIGCEIAGPPVFWAPPPLCTTLISRAGVSVWPFRPDDGLNPNEPEPMTFAGVDLDVWAHEALDAIDRFLSPPYDGPANAVDALGETGYVERLRAAKRSLAGSIASTVRPVLADPPPPADPATVADARSSWERQLLIALGSAYTAAAAVQLPVTVAGDRGTGSRPPVLHGHPEAGSRDGDATIPPYSLSAFEVPAASGAGSLTFLVTAGDPARDAYARLELACLVDGIEHGDSVRRTFPIPLPLPFASPELSTVEIPIVLRLCPSAPELGAQRATQALDTADARSLLATATRWTYAVDYSERHAAQDVTEATIAFDVEPSAEGPAPAAGSVPDAAGVPAAGDQDPFAALARLLAVLPALQAVFDADLAQVGADTDTTSPRFTRAANAMEAFATLVEDVAADWAPVDPTPASAGGGEAIDGPGLEIAIAEGGHPPPGGPDLLVTIAAEGARPSGVPMPAVVFEGHAPVATGAGVRYRDQSGGHLSWEQARQTAVRTVATGPLAVLGLQNAQMGMRLRRNAALVPANPTLAPFVYTTPRVTFPGPCTPLLQVGDPIDVAAVATGSPVARTLAEQLGSMFEGLLQAGAPGTRSIRLQIGYGYAEEPDQADGGRPPVQVPVALVPAVPVAVPVEPDSPSVARVAQLIRDWVGASRPPANGRFTFDLTAFSTLGDETQPLVRLSELALDRADVTDL